MDLRRSFEFNSFCNLLLIYEVLKTVKVTYTANLHLYFVLEFKIICSPLCQLLTNIVPTVICAGQ